MRTPLPNPGLPRRAAGRCSSPAILAATASFCVVAASFAAPAEPATHTLFMGADFSVGQANGVHRVRDVSGDSFVVEIDGRSALVPMRGSPVNLKIDSALKLTEVSATITNLKGERAYTPENDPVRNFQKGLADAATTTADYAYNVGYASDVLGNAQNVTVLPDPTGRNWGEQQKAKRVNAATARLNSAVAGPGRTYHVLNGSDIGAEGFDAMDVTFEISAERPLTHPYVVVVTRFREKDSPAGSVRNWIYAQSLPAVGGDVKKVHFLRGGFPAGFELVDFQLHLYSRGEEVTTNVAPNRVPLTREDAFQYVRLQYVAGHKNATLPATPAMGKLPADLPSRLANGQFVDAVYVKVAPDGKPSAVFRDPACSQKIDDAYLAGLLTGLRFKPALDKGTPVNGVACVRLADLLTSL